MALAASVAALSLGAVPVQATVTINQAALDGLTAMSALNVITLGDLNQNSQDVEGKTWVGGNLNINGSFSAGIGSSASAPNAAQGAAVSNYATVTVVGASNGAINLNDGRNGSSGTVGTGHYGVVIGGDSGKINFNADGATVKIGGSVNQDLNIGAGANISIHGFVASVTGGAGSTVNAGSVGTKVQVGNGSHVTVATGNISGDVTAGSNSSVVTGGSVGGLSLGANSTATIGGNVGPNLNLDTNDQVVIGGTYLSQNVNGLPSGTTVSANGSKQTQNSVPAGWTFNAGLSIATPTAPPVVDLASDKALMISNLNALSLQLGSLDAGTNVVSKLISGSVYDELFKVTDTSNGYAMFDITSAELFGARNIGFDLGGTTASVIINVSGAGGTFAQNAASVGTWDSSLNQQIIWNFTDATSLTVNSILHGSVLATKATVSNSTPIEGSLVAQVFNQSGEVHLGTFSGAIPPLVTIHTPPTGTVPEPASWMMMLGGFGGLGSILRRQRRSEGRAAA